MKRLPLLVIAMLMALRLTAQSGMEPEHIQDDTLSQIPDFSLGEARDYVDHVVRTHTFWKTEEDSLRNALRRLVDHSREPFDSIRTRLLLKDLGQIQVEEGEPLLMDSMVLRWLNDSTFLIDPQGWSPGLYLKKEEQLIYPEDTVSAAEDQDSLTIKEIPVLIPDTVIVTLLDTFAIESLGIGLHSFRNGQVSPPLQREGLDAVMSQDRKQVFYYLPGVTWVAAVESPFRLLEGPYQLDSLQHAMNTLLEYTFERDSTLLLVNDMYGSKFPFWLSQGDDLSYRFWVKNYNNDSITVWIGTSCRTPSALP